MESTLGALPKVMWPKVTNLVGIFFSSGFQGSTVVNTWYAGEFVSEGLDTYGGDYGHNWTMVLEAVGKWYFL